MNDHLDVHYDDMPRAFMQVGEITEVFCKDHPKNEGGSVTLYQVTLYQQWPSTVGVVSDAVPALGQMAGGAIEYECPYLKGQLVEVGFTAGDINRPIILGAFPRVSGDSKTAIAQTQAEHPRPKFNINGVSFVIDKDGDFKLDLAEGKSIVIKDSAGNVLFEIIKTGGSYEVHLGGDLGLKRLITEDIVGALASVFTSAAVFTGDGGSMLKKNVAAALNATFATATSTSIVKAK